MKGSASHRSLLTVSFLLPMLMGMLMGMLMAMLMVMLLGAITVYGDDRAKEPANYAFANYIGSGVYKSSDREVTVLNIPIRYTPEQQSSWPLTLRLPLSVGFYDFDFDEVSGGDLPGNADTLTFVPGVEWRIPLSEQLHIVPYVDLGLGHNFTSHESLWIYSIGISSHYAFADSRNREPRHWWVNRLFYAGYRGESTDVKDGFASLQSGLDWRTPLTLNLAGRRSFVTLYGLAQWHLNRIELFRPDQRTETLENNFEVGFTFQFEDPIKISIIELKQLGVGYRFGNGLNFWRLVFSQPI